MKIFLSIMACLLTLNLLDAQPLTFRCPCQQHSGKEKNKKMEKPKNEWEIYLSCGCGGGGGTGHSDDIPADQG